MSEDPRIERFANLLAKQPENELFRFSLAQALEAGGRVTDAIAHYERCVASKTDWMMPRIVLGKLLLRQNQTEAARPLLEAALALALAQDHEEPAAELQALLAGLR